MNQGCFGKGDPLLRVAIGADIYSVDTGLLGEPGDGNKIIWRNAVFDAIFLGVEANNNWQVWGPLQRG